MIEIDLYDLCEGPQFFHCRLAMINVKMMMKRKLYISGLKSIFHLPYNCFQTGLNIVAQNRVEGSLDVSLMLVSTT